MPERILPPPPASPCIGVCVLDGRGWCRGCLRTVEEITRWSLLSPAEQWGVVAACRSRRATGGAG